MSTALDLLRRRVEAACVESDTTMVLYATWQVARDDKLLHARLGVSYATNAYRAIVTALRREVLMGLLRLWDRSKGGVRVDKIATAIRKQETIEGLVEARNVTKHARFAGMVSAESILEEMRESLKSQASAFLEVVDKYNDNGEGAALLKKFRTLRHERLAHFDISAMSAPKKNATDQEIDQFYSDSTNMVQVLRGLVLAEFFDPAEAANVHRYYAKYFWASVRGERTEGHPNFRPADQ